MPARPYQVFPAAARLPSSEPDLGGENMIGGRPVPTQAVFTRADARRCGWTDSALSRALRAGRLVQVRRGSLSLPHTSGAAIRAAAAACTGSVVSHYSALEVHGLPIVGRRPSLPQVTVAPNATGSLTGARLHRAGLRDHDVVPLGDVLVTSVARTLIDVARHAPLSAVVPAMDAALHRRLVRYDELDDVVLACWNWPGIRRVHRAIDYTDGRAESPLESISRLVFGWLGLPRPEPQAVVLDEAGQVRARLDFYWDEFGVAGEADGRSKYDARDVLTREKRRQEEIEDLGIVVTRWGWDAGTRPQQFRAQIERAFQRGAARARSGFPRRWSIRHTEPVGGGENVIATRAAAGKT